MGQFGMDEENEKKVETVEELKNRRKAFAYWTVGGEDYKLKLTTQQICKLEEKFRCNGDIDYAEWWIATVGNHAYCDSGGHDALETWC